MIIRSVKLYNFGIYSHEQAVFPSAVNEHGQGKPVTLLGGYNGRGKTTFLEAVLLVLYGNRSPVLRRRKQSYSSYLESLIHKNGELDAQTWVELCIDLPGNGEITSLRIHRSWLFANVRGVEKLSIWRDGFEDPYMADNWDSYVDELVPVAISELFFFDGERISELAESDETVDTLQEAIRSMLGLEVVERLLKDLALVIRNHRREIKNSEVRDEIKRLEFEQEVLELQVSQTAQSIASNKNRIELLNEQQNDLKTKYNKSGGNLIASRDKLLSNRDRIQAQLNETKMEIVALASGALPLLLVESQIEKMNELVQEDQKHTQARLALPLLKQHNEDLLRELTKASSDQKLLEQMELYMGERTRGLNELAAQEPRLPLSFTGAAQVADLLGGGASTQLRQQAEELKVKYDAIVNELEQVEGHLLVEVDHESTTTLFEQLSQSRFELKDAQKEYEQLLKEKASLDLRQKQLEQKFVQVVSKVADVEESERIVTYAVKAQETTKAFRDQLTKKKIDLLSTSIFDAFDELTHKTTLVNKIEVNPTNFRISLLNSAGMEVSKSKLSSGERQMLAVAILWGLEKVSEKSLPVIIDTPMGRLDSMHRMNFVEKYLPKASHQVIVLSTDTEIVGDYLDSLREHVGQEYLLKYEDESRSTRVIHGYFDSLEVVQ